MFCQAWSEICMCLTGWTLCWHGKISLIRLGSVPSLTARNRCTRKLSSNTAKTLKTHTIRPNRTVIYSLHLGHDYIMPFNPGHQRPHLNQQVTASNSFQRSILDYN